MRPAVLLDQSVQPIKNMAPNPAFNDLIGSSFNSTNIPGVTTRVTTGGPLGGAFARRTVNAAATTAAGQDLHLYGTVPWVAGSGATLGGVCAVSPSAYTTTSMWARCSKAIGVRIQHQYLKANTGASSVGPAAAEFSLPANTWTRLVLTSQAGADSQALRLDIDSTLTGPITWAIGDTLDVANIMVTPGEKDIPYSDGTFPGWRWLGTPGASESVGYPYTLESIAGRPLFFAENVASTGSNVNANMDGTDGLTILSAQSVSSAASSPGFWDLRGTVGGANYRRLLGTGAQYRLDAFLNDTSLSATGVPINPVGNTVTASRLRPGATGTIMDLLINGGAVNNHLSPAVDYKVLGGGLSIRVGTRDNIPYPEVKNYGIAVYKGILSDDTIRRLTAWMARKYGTPIPAGY